MRTEPGHFSHTRRMPGIAHCDVVPGDEAVGSCAYDYDVHGPTITTEPPPPPTASPTPPLAPYPNPVERQKQKAADCNRMVKEALDMTRTLHCCVRRGDRAGERAVVPQYLRHLKRMGDVCGQPLRGLHYEYSGQLVSNTFDATDVYDGSGAPIAKRSLDIATELTRRNRMWDQEVLRGELTWADWFVNAMGRRPRW
jgi:hypothetical protein